MFSKESRPKLTWRVRYEDQYHAIAIFPPCSFENIIQRIETSFDIKWPFLIFDGKGSPAHLSDCMASGTYTLKPKIDKNRFVAPRVASKPVDDDAKGLESLPSVKEILEEWPPFLATSHIIWRTRETVFLNYYDTHLGAAANGHFFVVATTSGEPRTVLGLKILSKGVLASMVTERDLVHETYKLEVEQLKLDIMEENEMRYGPPLPESVALNMAIDQTKKQHSSVGNRGEWRLLNNPTEQKVAYHQERECIEIEKAGRKSALQKVVVRLAQQRIDINLGKALKFLVFEGDPSGVETKMEHLYSDQNESMLSANATKTSEVPREHFQVLLKRHRNAIDRIHLSTAESDAVRENAMRELEKTNLQIAKRMIWMHQVDIEEKARDERIKAERENAATCIQEMWKDKKKRKQKKGKSKKGRQRKKK